MNKQEKQVLIADLHQEMANAQATFLVNYKGLNVPLLQSLRKSVREDGAQVKVTKATLMRLAAKDIEGADEFAESFKEQVALVFAKNDVSATAKKIVNFSKENEALKVIAGFYQSKLLSKQELTALASLPSREVLLAQLLGTMQAPIATVTRQLGQLLTKPLYALKAIEEKKQQGN